MARVAAASSVEYERVRAYGGIAGANCVFTES